MSHYSLLCFIFINSLTVFTVFTFRSFSAVRTAAATVSPRLLHTALPSGNWLPALRVRESGPDIPVCVWSLCQCTWREDINTFLYLTMQWVSNSPPSFRFMTQAKRPHYSYCRLVVLPKPQFLVICFAQSDWTSLSTWHTNMKLNIYSGIRFAEWGFLAL